jgi:hypothetical protein
MGINLRHLTVENTISTGIPWDIPRLPYPHVEIIGGPNDAPNRSQMCAVQKGVHSVPGEMMYVIIEIDDIAAEAPLKNEQADGAPTTCKVKADGSCGGLY